MGKAAFELSDTCLPMHWFAVAFDTHHGPIRWCSPSKTGSKVQKKPGRKYLTPRLFPCILTLVSQLTSKAVNKSG